MEKWLWIKQKLLGSLEEGGRIETIKCITLTYVIPLKSNNVCELRLIIIWIEMNGEMDRLCDMRTGQRE
jgi:hypothetical protein